MIGLRKYIFLLLTILLLPGLAVSGPGLGQGSGAIANGSLSGEITSEYQRLATSLSDRWRQGRLEAEQRAIQLGLPIRREVGDQVKELQFFRDGMPYYYVTYNLEAAITISTRSLWAGGGAAYDLNGLSETLGVWDSGRVLLSHQEFGGRVSQIDGSTDNSNHATHVAGTMVAAGVASQARGMSGSARLHAYDWNDDLSEMLMAASLGLRVSNHSYGFIAGWHWAGNIWRWYGHHDETEAWGFGFYDQNAQMWDQVTWAKPYYLPVKAAGNNRVAGPIQQPVIHEVMINGQWVRDSTTIRQVGGGLDGYDCLPFNSVSKNILTVGAVYNIQGGYDEPGDVIMSPFSSWGPTDDGRVKPDLVASGVGLYSTSSTGDAAYTSMSGTSMAAPNVSGSIGLLLQLYRGIHGNDSIRAASMKALLIHTADEAGDGPGPDYRHGWGLMNTLSAARILSDDQRMGKHFLLREKYLHQNESISIPVFATGDEPLVATIVWTDPPGTPLPPQLNPDDLMLVNDLDLRIISDNGQHTYYPFVLDPDHPAQPATTGDNFRDNVEKVYLESAEANGLYHVQISHKGELQGGGQSFSLVLSGVSAATTFSGPGTLWDNPANWSHGVPEENHSVIIADGGQAVLSGDAECRNLLVEAGAQLTLQPTARLSVEGGIHAGDEPGRLNLQATREATASLIHHNEGVPLTMEKHLDGDWPSPMGQWHLVSTPVAGQGLDEFTPPWEAGEYTLYNWQESTGQWSVVPNSEHVAFEPGKGYLASWEYTTLSSFSGKALVGDISMQNLSLSPQEGEGWHLLGNPFASAVLWDADAWELNGLTHTAKLWRQGGYVDLFSSEGYIPSMEGFFVQLSEAENSLTIPAAARRHLPAEGEDRYGPGKEEQRVVLQARGLSSEDLQQAVIRFVPGPLEGFDPRYDARFLAGHGPGFHALKGQEALSSISLPGPPGDVRIPFRFAKTTEETVFEVRLLESNVDKPIYLYDRLKGEVTNISGGNPYLFESVNADYPWPRFEIHISSSLLPTGISTAADKQGFIAWYHDGLIHVTLRASSGVLHLYDLTGRSLSRHLLDSQGTHTLAAPAAPGLYLLRFESKERLESQRILVR